VTTEVLFSDEGCTQGDVVAMAFYALSVKPLTDELREAVDTTRCKQALYADDANAFGKIEEIRIYAGIIFRTTVQNSDISQSHLKRS
jgi:hypothetical protein